MSSKSKWDQPATGSGADDSSEPKSVVKDSKSASEAAAAAAAIAAKIAAQFANGTLGQKDHDNEYWKDIDINDVRNRYVLTKGSTQQQARSQVFYDIVLTAILDSGRNGRVGKHEGCMVSRQDQGHREGSSPLSAYFGSFPRLAIDSHRKNQ